MLLSATATSVQSARRRRGVAVPPGGPGAKNAVAKAWSITPSSDTKRWSAWPAGDKPPSGVSVESNPQTFAANATGSGTRYDVANLSQFDAVPWSTLTAGSVVNVSYNGGTVYPRRVGIITSATEANPIRIIGVTDASGNRPRIDFDNASIPATSLAAFTTSIADTTLVRLGGWFVKAPDAARSNRQAYITFENFEFFGAEPGNTFTSQTGSVVEYDAFAAALNFRNADDCDVINCVFHDNAQGVFTQANSVVWCNRISLLYNRFYGNGQVARGTEHNVYIQCSQPIMIGNYFGPLRSGAIGSSVKSRCTDQTILYNWFECGARSLDLVHPEDEPPFLAAADMKAVVGGNIFVNDTISATSAYVPIHIGGDNSGEEDGTSAGSPPLTVPLPTRYVDKMYFFNNTYISRTVNDSFDRVILFDTSLTTTEVIAWNNIIACYGTTPGGSQKFHWVEYAGIVNRRGKNLEFGTIFDCRDDANTSKVDVNLVGTAVTTDPLLTSLSTFDYRLQSGSPARGQAQVPAGVPSGILSGFPIQFQPRQRTNGVVARDTVNDLGALEFGVS